MSYTSKLDWSTEIVAAEEFRKKDSFYNRWGDFEDYYLNWSTNLQKTTPELNLIYMHGRALLPTLVYTNPTVNNTPRQPQFIPWASFLDSIGNWLIKEMEVEEILKSACLNAFLYNMGALQVGYDFPSTQYKIDKDNVLPSLYGDPNFPPVKGVVNRSRRQNFPYINLINPKKLIFPYGTLNVRTCRWYGEQIVAFTEDVKQWAEIDDPSKVKSTHYLSKGGVLLEKEQNPNCDVTMFYRITNACDMTFAYIYPDGTYLKEWTRDPLQVDGLNLEVISFNESPRNIWGTPDASYVEAQMLEGNEVRRTAKKHRAFGFLKGLVDEEMYDKNELEKFMDGEFLPFLRAKSVGDKRLTDGIGFLQPHIPQDLYPYMKSIYEDSQLILGFGYNQMGVQNPGRRTKYEVATVEDKNALRVSERRQIVAKSLSGIMRKVNQLVVKHWDFPILQQVIGVDGAMYWVEGRPSTFSNLKAELVTSVDVDSMAPHSLEKTKGELIEVIGLLGRIPNLNVIPLLRQLLSKFPYIDVSQALPQAVQSGNMPLDQFASQQNNMMQSPELAERLKSNLVPFISQMQPKAPQQKKAVKRA